MTGENVQTLNSWADEQQTIVQVSYKRDDIQILLQALALKLKLVLSLFVSLVDSGANSLFLCNHEIDNIYVVTNCCHICLLSVLLYMC